MVDTHRQVPHQPATAWLVDLSEVRGPMLVVLRRRDDLATAAAAEYLISSGAASSLDEAQELLQDAVRTPVEVVW